MLSEANIKREKDDPTHRALLHIWDAKIAKNPGVDIIFREAIRIALLRRRELLARGQD